MLKMQGFWSGVLVAGMLLLATSWFWPAMVGGRQNWSDAQAKEYADTLAEYHRANGESAQLQEQLKQRGMGDAQARIADSRLADAARTGTSVDPTTATADRAEMQLAAVKERYQKQLTALDEARSRGEGAAKFMRWTGLGIVAAGLIGLWSTRSGGTP